MGAMRQTLKKRFGTPEKEVHLRIIASTIGPGKARLLGLIAEKESLSEAAREMKMSYKRAWQLIEAMNGCFREPLVESKAGGRRGGGAQWSAAGRKVLALHEAIYARSMAASAKELRQLQGMLKP